MRVVFLLFLSVVFFPSFAQQMASKESGITLQTPTGDIFGSLLLPDSKLPVPVVILVAGSGPTDRDGNNPFMKNESLKLLAQGLAEKGIASLRYDKRGIAASGAAMKSEADLRFQDYIRDVESWIALLKKDKRFSSIHIAGHSEGSLIGMVAAQRGADGFVSIAGPGRPVDALLKEQLQGQPEPIRKSSIPIIDSLKGGHQVKAVHPMLFALFRPQIQPYLISLFSYDPQTEIKKLKIPVLVIQGDNDLQVKVEDAQALAAAHPKSKTVVIRKMNHVLKLIEGGQAENAAAYNNPSLPVSTELIEAISQFIKNNKK